MNDTVKWIRVKCSGCGRGYIRATANSHASSCCGRDMVPTGQEAEYQRVEDGISYEDRREREDRKREVRL